MPVSPIEIDAEIRSLLPDALPYGRSADSVAHRAPPAALAQGSAVRSAPPPDRLASAQFPSSHRSAAWPVDNLRRYQAGNVRRVLLECRTTAPAKEMDMCTTKSSA